ncbi:hypothetical protein AAF712_005541 [Marasmius tenuissimus]|uniref:Uncharacterized protein n=1 Tax=Marasmius tenuissimus TaxID=585030 RepID=A0ABR3A162_9AGAR
MSRPRRQLYDMSYMTQHFPESTNWDPLVRSIVWVESPTPSFEGAVTFKPHSRAPKRSRVIIKVYVKVPLPLARTRFPQKVYCFTMSKLVAHLLILDFQLIRFYEKQLSRKSALGFDDSEEVD